MKLLKLDLGTQCSSVKNGATNGECPNDGGILSTTVATTTTCHFNDAIPVICSKMGTTHEKTRISTCAHCTMVQASVHAEVHTAASNAFSLHHTHPVPNGTQRCHNGLVEVHCCARRSLLDAASLRACHTAFMPHPSHLVTAFPDANCHHHRRSSPSRPHTTSFSKYFLFLLFLFVISCSIAPLTVTAAATTPSANSSSAKSNELQNLYLSCNPEHNPVDDKYCGVTQNRPCSTFLFMMNSIVPLYLKVEDNLQIVLMEPNCEYNISCWSTSTHSLEQYESIPEGFLHLGQLHQELGSQSTLSENDFLASTSEFLSEPWDVPAFSSPVHISGIQNFAIQGNGLKLTLHGLYRDVPLPLKMSNPPVSFPAHPRGTYFSFDNIEQLLLNNITMHIDRMGNETAVLSVRNVKSLHVINFNMRGMLKEDSDVPEYETRAADQPFHAIELFSVGQFLFHNISLHRFYNRFDAVIRMSTVGHVEFVSLSCYDVSKPFQETGPEAQDQTFLVLFELHDLFHSFVMHDAFFSNIALQNGFLFIPRTNSSQLVPRGKIEIDSCQFFDVQTSPFLEFYTTGLELTRSIFYRSGREQNGFITSGVSRHLIMDDNTFFAVMGNIYSSNGDRGLIRINNPKPALIKNSIFARNIFHYMILSTHSIDFEDCVFTQNQNAALNSSLNGGSIFMLFARDDTLYIKANFKRCEFSGNRAVESGAIQGVNNVNISVYDSVFFENYGVRGGAIRIDNNFRYHSMLYLYNSTFDENVSETHSGAVSCEEGGAVYLYNNTRFLSNYKSSDLAQIDCDRCRVGGDNPQHLCESNIGQEWFLLYVGVGVAGGAIMCVSISLCLVFGLGYWCNQAFGNKEKQDKHIVHEIFTADDDRSPDDDDSPVQVVIGGPTEEDKSPTNPVASGECNPLLSSPLQIQQR
uniref:Right handed beta helix domain-containing protein n=1 Tax=Percolomonas cosmopolitus TaxID=63605 RepID=A0A7S1KQX1_9EUKA|mmetsp:Transcript_5673/g.21387  ORF Transcript_5673/g.21387 Transcript_5673/m.21387 type:complete len:918 (+) Transcript_5673:217-2970(+)